MILYEDEKRLRRILTSIVEAALKNGGICSFVSGHPTRERRFLARIMKRAGSRRQAGPFVNDARRLLIESQDPLGSFSNLWERMEKEYRPNEHRWTNIGNFLHEFYPRFGVALEIERWLAAQHPPASVVCCYRNEGFSSLDPKDILAALALHDRVIFRTAVF